MGSNQQDRVIGSSDRTRAARRPILMGSKQQNRAPGSFDRTRKRRAGQFAHSTIAH
jgi:hypothetical protein